MGSSSSGSGACSGAASRITSFKARARLASVRAERSASAELAAPSTLKMESIASSSRSTTRWTRTASASRDLRGRLAASGCRCAFDFGCLRAAVVCLALHPDDLLRARPALRGGDAARGGQPHSAIRASSVRRVIFSEAAGFRKGGARLRSAQA